MTKKKALLVVGLALVLALAGVVYAHWSDTLQVQVNTVAGTINPQWSLHGTNDDGIDDTYGTAGWDDEPAAAPIWGSGSSRDPAAKFTDPAYARYPKDVADCIATLSSPNGETNDLLTVNLSNVYPSYWCTVLADLENMGSVPVKLQAMTISATRDPDGGGALPAVPVNIVPVAGGWYLDDGTGIYPELEVFFEGAPFYSCGYQLDPAAPIEFYGHFHPDQDAVQGATYSVAVDFSWVNYNEYDPAAATGCLNVVPGNLIPLGGSSAGMRVKAQGGEGIYLGEGDLGVGANRVWAPINFAGGTGTYPFTMTFDAVADTLTLVGPGTANPGGLVWNTANPPTTCLDWDVLSVMVRDSRTDAGVALQNVVLNGVPMGNFGTVSVLGAPGLQYWSVVGFNFTGNWTVTGDLVTQNFVGNEALKIELTLGCQ